MLAEIKTGVILGTDGTVSPGRSSRIGAEVNGYGQGKYYEQTSRGNVFSLIQTAWTTGIAAGNLALSSAAGSALTGSTILQSLCAADLGVGAGSVTTANNFENKLTEYLDGSIVVSPGTCWVPTWITAGTTVLGGYSITWEEIPQ